jgi:hypothetical protein
MQDGKPNGKGHTFEFFLTNEVFYVYLLTSQHLVIIGLLRKKEHLGADAS